eukprot:CAMPEP_0180184336 /NCGR_PEP_ID=MMETSP0986-20121125/41761_1 /TAXON_ID=697907 /ORGANISM="non described non described, Strain CCMP2293" /LENGTH=499 /DNA_ID=CAMNT_0022137997 /DNA_START=100 /DNA_END=1600 /DNA_ORIENTATION=-
MTIVKEEGYADHYYDNAYESDLHLGHDSALASHLQGLYQDLGLDPIVTSLELDRSHPTMRHLAEATQANAASSLIELGYGARGCDEQPAKRPRVESGLAPHPAHHTPGKDPLEMRETPVRRRVSVEDSPKSYNGHGAVRFESPKAGQAQLSSSSSVSPMQQSHAGSPVDAKEAARMEHSVVALLQSGVNGKARRACRVTAEEAPRTPPSEDSPPRAKKPGEGAGRQSRINATVLVEKDKKNQGLRQFSLRVCRQVVEHKMTTTYNEVADELVKEFKDEETDVCDEKNIRRRAYDALNVLTAMDIIAKDKKDIRWKGFPPMIGDDGAQSAGNHAQREKKRLRQKIEQKKQEVIDKETQLRELASQFVCLRQLLDRNAKPEFSQANTKTRIFLPFVIVNTEKDNTIECEISENKQAAEFTCSDPFWLHDDRETLNMMHSTLCPEDAMHTHLPEDVAKFVMALKPKRKRGGGAGLGSSSALPGSDDDCDVEHEEMAESEGEL